MNNEIESALDELLNLSKNSNIDADSVMQQYLMRKKDKKLIEEHPYKPWKGSDGKWRVYLPDPIKGRVLKTATTEEGINKAILKYQKSERFSVNKVAEQWLEYKRDYDGLQGSSIRRYNNGIKKYFAVDDFGQRKIDELTVYDLDDHIRKCVTDLKLTTKTKGELITVVKGVFTFAVRKGYTKLPIQDFFNVLAIPKTIVNKEKKNPLEQVFRLDELKQIRKYLYENPTVRRLGLLLDFETGLRAGELATLKREDWQGDYLIISRTEQRSGLDEEDALIVSDHPKTDNGNRMVVLTDLAKEVLQMIIDMNPEGEYLFTTTTGKFVRGSYFNKELHAVQKKLGYTNLRSTHAIRRTYASRLMEAGISETMIQYIMGHSDPTTVRRYYNNPIYTPNKYTSTIRSALAIES